MNEFGEASLGGWWAGLTIGFLLVLVVVVVVGAILALATQIGSQVDESVVRLDASRLTTQPLVELNNTNDTLRSILRNASTARRALGG